MTRTTLTRRARTAAAATLVGVPLLFTAACVDPPCCQPVPVAHQLYILLDQSGSMFDYMNGYPTRLAPTIDQLEDGTLVTVALIAGSSESSLCIPISTTLQGDGPNTTQAGDDLAADKQAVIDSLQTQIDCATKQGPTSTDLLGALDHLADEPQPDKVKDVTILAMTDGIISSRELSMSGKFLSNRPGIDKTLDKLTNQGLIPQDLTGDITLIISDPGVGANLNVTQASGLRYFWRGYTDTAGWTYKPTLRN